MLELIIKNFESALKPIYCWRTRKTFRMKGNNLTNKASSQANDWASQRREAIDKAKKIQEERKSSLAKTGEMAINYGNLTFIP